MSKADILREYPSYEIYELFEEYFRSNNFLDYKYFFGK